MASDQYLAVPPPTCSSLVIETIDPKHILLIYGAICASCLEFEEGFFLIRFTSWIAILRDTNTSYSQRYLVG